MSFLPTGLPCAPTPEAFGFRLERGITGRRLGRVATVFRSLVFEFLDPPGERVDHLSLLVELGAEGLDEIDDGIDALLVNRYDVFTRHHGRRIIFRIPPPPQSVTCYLDP